MAPTKKFISHLCKQFKAVQFGSGVAVMALFPHCHWGQRAEVSQLQYVASEVTLGVNIHQRKESTEDRVWKIFPGQDIKGRT